MPEANPSDQQLVMLVHAGDPEPFGQLYERHVDVVTRFLRRHTRDPNLAEDLASEAFLRALKNLHTFTTGSFVGWVSSIARNLLIDHYRCSRVRGEVLVDECWDADRGTIAGPEVALTEKLDRAHARDRVAAMLTGLTVEQRTCLHLRFFQHRTVAETAKAMARSEGAVKVLQHRAIHAMRRAAEMPARQLQPVNVAREVRDDVTVATTT